MNNLRVAVNIVGYQVIVERLTPTLRVFSADLPATATKVTVPSAFMEPHTEYAFEVLAIDASGKPDHLRGRVQD